MPEKPCIILGVTASIAAHKAIDITSELTKRGCAVHVVMTPDALKFVTPLPFKTLSRNPVITDLFAEAHGWQPTHIDLAERADLCLVAPATADIIAKLAAGIADDALSCLVLALRAETPVLIAPAMHTRMWQHPATRSNVDTLKHRGVEFIGPDSGPLACGAVGPGRLAPVEQVVAAVLAKLRAVGKPVSDTR